VLNAPIGKELRIRRVASRLPEVGATLDALAMPTA
jgi:hypothetical protein